jgi:hypothetical protein
MIVTIKKHFMKIIKLLIPAIFFCNVVAGQNGITGIDGGMNLNSPNFFLINTKDAKDAGVFNPDMYSGVEGSPYLSDDWAYARIKLNDNRVFDSVLLKVNLYENRVHFKDENGREKMLSVPVKEIEIKDASSKWNNAVFVTGYGEDKNIFYQALTDGKKAGLLKTVNVTIKESKVFNGPNQKSFAQQGRLYIFSKGILYEESKKCASVLNAFANDSKITGFISANDIKCNKEMDLKKLVEYYNSY